MRAFADKCTCITCCKNQQTWGTKMALKNPKYDSSYMIMMMLSIWLWHRTKAMQSWCVLQIVWRPSHPRWIMKDDDVNVVSSWFKELLCPASQRLRTSPPTRKSPPLSVDNRPTPGDCPQFVQTLAHFYTFVLFQLAAGQHWPNFFNPLTAKILLLLPSTL